jgi:ABC-type microcin C transport system permease subunit YejE
MNRNYEASSKRARATFAIAAVLISVLIGNGIDGLAGHYHGKAELASQPPVTLAQR